MGIILVLLPISICLAVAGLAAYLWCVRTGQYEDLDGPAVRVLFDEAGERVVKGSNE